MELLQSTEMHTSPEFSLLHKRNAGWFVVSHETGVDDTEVLTRHVCYTYLPIYFHFKYLIVF